MLGNPKIQTMVDGSLKILEEDTDPDAFIGDALLIVEVRNNDGNTAFFTFCTDKRQWIQAAMIREGDAAVTLSGVDFIGE